MSKRLIAGVLSALSIAGLVDAYAATEQSTTEQARIAFLRATRGGAHCAIFTMNADGRDQQRLTDWNLDCASRPIWSPDGTRIAFYARGQLWLMNEDGRQRRRLSAAWYDEAGDEAPSFSPDGRSIVFSRNPSSTVNASAIYVVRGHGRPKRLTRERFAWDPLWSPGGDLIAFRSDRDDSEGDGDIWVMRGNGTGQRKFLRERDDPASFVWSPDGRFLAYAFYAGPSYSVPATGSPRRRLARVSGAEPGLAWSPDGRHIAYENDEVRNDIYVMTARGFAEHRLTRHFFNYGVSWAPDSRKLVFAFFTRLGGPSRRGIAVINIAGSGRRVLTTGDDSFPAWQLHP